MSSSNDDLIGMSDNGAAFAGSHGGSITPSDNGSTVANDGSRATSLNGSLTASNEDLMAISSDVAPSYQAPNDSVPPPADTPLPPSTESLPVGPAPKLEPAYAYTKYKIKVKTLTGREIKFEVEDSEKEPFTIGMVKETINEKESIPADQQRLIYCGKQLPDDSTVRSHNIHLQDVVLHLVLNLRGGA
ncbi:hypothetical protein EW145_g5906 [Phellinidium pouzarii]|uniref:Ubiquitin-like domain-containing protein n=1 Tax=Phellinidium pouzarii TaxID=167371 RepID=A0A4S4L072_9AGAM|nr:hypothetical protein EW145_g5906 [Phellinidium pouzarii]